jgi:hypothetical protein
LEVSWRVREIMAKRCDCECDYHRKEVLGKYSVSA